MIGGHPVHGHAIVSADDCIAAADGTMPADLHDDSDWVRFQEALDRAAVTVLGRQSHAAYPNEKKRNRLIVSSSAEGIEKRADGWWWNPDSASAEAALHAAAPDGGVAAVVGGRRVFDLFLRDCFDAFHLVRAGAVALPGGIPVFSEVGEGLSADDVLRRHGLEPGRTEWLDRRRQVALTVWQRGRAP